MYYGSNGSGGALLRGLWNGGTLTGPFSVYLHRATSYTSSDVGLRCAWQPYAHHGTCYRRGSCAECG